MNSLDKITIQICMGSACFARGNNENLEIIEKFVEENKINANIEVLGSRCEGNCAKGPNLSINGQSFNGITPAQIKQILSDYFSFSKVN